MVHEPHPVRKSPDGGYLVASFDDAQNVVAGCDFETRVQILMAVETRLQLQTKAPEYGAQEEAYCVWAYTYILRELMRRRGMPWREAVELIPFEVIPPIFRRVDLSKRFTEIRQRLYKDVVEHGTLVASAELHRAVIASFHPRTPEGAEAALRDYETLEETDRPFQLPNGTRYHARVLRDILDYYGLALRARTNQRSCYRVRHGLLALLTRHITSVGRLDLAGLYWMKDRYNLAAPV